MASYPVSVRRVRDFVIGFLQIPPRDGHPCLDGWFRSSRSMGDFHPLNASHTEHTRRNRLSYLLVARLAKNLSGIGQNCLPSQSSEAATKATDEERASAGGSACDTLHAQCSGAATASYRSV